MKSEEIVALLAENEKLKQQNQWLLEQLKLAKHRQFGASSEKSQLNGGEQLGLFNEAEAEASIAPEPELKEIKAYRRRKAGEVGIGKLPEDLPVEVIEYDISAEEKTCPDCGNPLHVMGREVREELKFVPAKAVIVRHESLTYACRCCEKCSDHVPIVKASMPKPVIKGSFASPEAIAHIACEKFVMGSPLYRQEQDWERKGIDLSRQTMSNWLISATKKWLFPVYDRLKSILLTNQVLHADETTVQVLHEPGKTPQSKSYMWLYRTSCDAKHAIVLYEYQPNRQSNHPKAFLSEFNGYLHADGYSGYHSLPKNITIIGCWAHARRKFDEALKVIAKEHQAKSVAMQGILRIRQLYALEDAYKKLPPDDNFKARLEARKKQSKPLVEAFFDWCKELPVLPRTNLGNAVNYCIGQRFWLEHFLIDGRLEIDNNRAERSIKPFVIGRKNWLFSNIVNGAKASAALYSIIETAKENGIVPFDYLTYVFRNAPNWDILNNPDSLLRLMPWNFISPAA
jgi:transposase